MTIEVFERASYIRRRISELNQIKSDFQRLKARDNDKDFNGLREVAITLLCDKIDSFESEFKELGGEKK